MRSYRGIPNFKLRKPLDVKLWGRVTKTPTCWVWTGKSRHRGYGAIWHLGKWLGAHRASWILSNGTIPDGASVLHRCDNPLCVRPSHLFLGTQADNGADMARKGRSLRGGRNASARLTEGAVRTIRAAVAEGETQRSVARRLGVSEAQLSRIIHRQSWSHV